MRQQARWLAAGVALALGISNAVVAEAAEADAKLGGVYWFRTIAKKRDGSPACQERWDLRADGPFKIESGEEIVEGRWREEVVDGQRWLVTSERRSNGRPDCAGDIATSQPASVRTLFYITAMGDPIICVVTHRFNGVAACSAGGRLSRQ